MQGYLPSNTIYATKIGSTMYTMLAQVSQD
jgi:hypothetical protein